MMRCNNNLHYRDDVCDFLFDHCDLCPPHPADVPELYPEAIEVCFARIHIDELIQALRNVGGFHD